MQFAFNSLHTCHKIVGTSFLPKKRFCSSRETSRGIAQVIKSQSRHFCRKKRRLRQPGRLQQESHMSQNPRNAIFAEKKPPAAGGKASTGIIHVIKCKERHFGLENRLLRQPGRPHRADTCHKIPGTSFLQKKSACCSREDLTRQSRCKCIYKMSLNVVKCR